MKLTKHLAFLLVAIGVISPFELPVIAAEPLDMRGFLELANSQASSGGTMIGLIGTAGDAFSWSNTELENRGDSPLYCTPNKLAVTNGQYLSILNLHIQSHPELGAMNWRSWPIMLLKGLQETFPCK